MYIPKETKHVRRRLSAKQRAKQTRLGVILALLVILLSAGWAMRQSDAASHTTGSSAKLLQHDLQSLWQWSDDQLRGGSEAANWTLRWNVTGRSGSMQELIHIFFVDDKGETIARVEKNEGKTVTGTVPTYGGLVSINLIQADDENEQLMVLLETNRSLPLTKNLLLQASSDISKKLALISPVFTSSMKVQGYTEQKQVTQRLVKLTNASLVDRYEDGGTISETYYTRMLRSAIAVENGKSANFQVAVHDEKNTKNTALTIGIPVITGEYSISTAKSP